MANGNGKKYNAFTPLRIANGRDGAVPTGFSSYTGEIVLKEPAQEIAKPASNVSFEQAKGILEFHGTYANEYAWRIQVYKIGNSQVNAALFIDGKPYSWDSTDEIVTGIKATLEGVLKKGLPKDVSKDLTKPLQDLLKSEHE